MIHAIIIATAALIMFGLSLIKDRQKSKKTIKVAARMFLKLARDIIAILCLVGLLLALVPPDLIKLLLGNTNRFISILSSSLLGAVTIIPGVIAFPLAKALQESGALISSLAAFITTLTMVGIATLPLEIKYFGRKFALVRNSLSFACAIIIALLMGLIL